MALQNLLVQGKCLHYINDIRATWHLKSVATLLVLKQFFGQQQGNTKVPHYWISWEEFTLRWRQNGRDSVSNHQPRHCLLSLLFGRRSKKTSKLRVTGLCVGNSPGPVNSPHKGPVTRKMFPFDDVIMTWDRWIPLEKDQWWRKRSHVMTSSCF